jgi:hypothetical protein
MDVAHGIGKDATTTNPFATAYHKYRFFLFQGHRQKADGAFSKIGAVGLCKQTFVVQFIRPFFTLSMVLLSMLFTAFSAAIFY